MYILIDSNTITNTNTILLVWLGIQLSDLTDHLSNYCQIPVDSYLWSISKDRPTLNRWHHQHFFLVSLLYMYKTDRFHVAVHLFSNWSHKTCQNVVRTSVTHSAITSCVTFLFLSHFGVINYWTDVQQLHFDLYQTANFWEMDSFHLQGADRLREVKTIEKPSSKLW